LPRNE